MLQNRTKDCHCFCSGGLYGTPDGIFRPLYTGYGRSLAIHAFVTVVFSGGQHPGKKDGLFVDNIIQFCLEYYQYKTQPDCENRKIQ
jgi:hypothetical protein